VELSESSADLYRHDLVLLIAGCDDGSAKALAAPSPVKQASGTE
jgi:hypothetical protein